MTQRFHKLDLPAVVLTALAAMLLSLKGPGLGDDFQYWYTAWGIHERGMAAWNTEFHTLRWPVWGVCWVLQAIFGPGLLSFYGVPFFYLSLGSILAYLIGLDLFKSRQAAWGAVLLYVFHPLLNSVIYRPMPDLSEGTYIALAVYLWMRLTEQEKTSRRALLAVTIGLVTGLVFSNRITGVFVFGVLGAITLAGCWRNERFTFRQAIPWLACIALVWVAYFCAEGLVYRSMTGDFLHSIHSNMGAKGRKGTESVNLLQLPFRFFGPLWKGSKISPLFTILAIVGIWPVWRYGGMRGRMVAAWAVALYLAYNCSLQSLFPPRPLLRDADRFLASLSIPLSLLIVGCLRWLVHLVETTPTLAKLRAIPAFARRSPVVVGVIAGILLFVTSRRTFEGTGFIQQLRDYLAQVPTGTRIFTHPTMRDFAFLASAADARRLEWILSKNLLRHNQKNETKARESDQFWYCRKKAWISIRKALEVGMASEQFQLASYFENPVPQWALKEVINVGGVPELIFYEKRATGNLPQAVPLKSLLAEFPDLPITWERQGKSKKSIDYRLQLPIPESIRGQALQFRIRGWANYVQAIGNIQIKFYQKKKQLEILDIRPYLYPTTGVDFQTFEIPADADSCRIRITMHAKAEKLAVEDVSVIIEQAGNGAEHTLPTPPAREEASVR